MLFSDVLPEQKGLYRALLYNDYYISMKKAKPLRNDRMKKAENPATLNPAKKSWSGLVESLDYFTSDFMMERVQSRKIDNRKLNFGV